MQTKFKFQVGQEEQLLSQVNQESTEKGDLNGKGNLIKLQQGQLISNEANVNKILDKENKLAIKNIKIIKKKLDKPEIELKLDLSKINNYHENSINQNSALPIFKEKKLLQAPSTSHVPMIENKLDNNYILPNISTQSNIDKNEISGIKQSVNNAFKINLIPTPLLKGKISISGAKRQAFNKKKFASVQDACHFENIPQFINKAGYSQKNSNIIKLITKDSTESNSVKRITYESLNRVDSEKNVFKLHSIFAKSFMCMRNGNSNSKLKQSKVLGRP
eukprot:403363560